jgi:SAM-dependent methyltransferase
MGVLGSRLRASALHARELRRHQTHACMTREIAALVQRYAVGRSLLFLGDDQGALRLLLEGRGGTYGAVMYGHGRNIASVRGRVEIVDVDLGNERFPAADGTFDVVVCNEWLMSLSNISGTIEEAWRVLATEGLLVVSTANLSALHNCFLLALGRQPSTMALDGPHLRGFAVHSMTSFLEGDGRFRTVALKGIGLHPFTSRVIPRPLDTYSHTAVWGLKKIPSTA